jgi:hypothetical protein
MVTVTLAFDGTFADGPEDAGPGLPLTTRAQRLLEDAGFHGTFFVNSALVGTSGHLSQDQLPALEARGHEIGGSTVDGLDLLTLDPKEQAREICVDRSWLLSEGLDVRSFAFPPAHGDGDPAHSGADNLVGQCGYGAARERGGLSGQSCPHCPSWVSLPPSDPMRLPTLTPVSKDTSAAALEAAVQTTPIDAGGWVIVVMDQICEGCDPSSISENTLAEFLTWLQEQQDAGTVIVQTVKEVVGQPLLSAVAGPEATPPGPDGNLLQNGSLEQYTGATGTPDCWAPEWKTTDAGLVSRVTDAHDGQFAQQIAITAYDGGDWRLMSDKDLGECAPAATPGHVYRLSAWVKPDGVAKFVGYLRDSAGVWSYWTESHALQVSTDAYVLQTWVTPPVPAGAVGLSVGVGLESNGLLTVDDLKLEDLGVPPPSGCATGSGAGDSLGLLVAILGLRAYRPRSRGENRREVSPSMTPRIRLISKTARKKIAGAFRVGS